MKIIRNVLVINLAQPLTFTAVIQFSNLILVFIIKVEGVKYVYFFTFLTILFVQIDYT